MLPDQEQPDQNTPNEAAEAQGRREDPQQAPDVATTAAPDGAQPTATQGNMGDGSGQRGGYGDSDQTNGMEGAADKSDESAN
jgi:hypothetical protein